MKKYDYLIVGSGLYGAVFAQQAQKKGKKVLVIDKRPNIAGNVYTEDIEKIHVHKYGSTENASTPNRSSTAVTANGAMVPRSSGMRCR